MSEPYVLTADDILQNKYLRQDGALPGDKIQGNNLIREFSNEGDKREEGYVLTEEDIENNKYTIDDVVFPLPGKSTKYPNNVYAHARDAS